MLEIFCPIMENTSLVNYVDNIMFCEYKSESNKINIRAE